MAGVVILKPDESNNLKKTFEVLGMHLKSISYLRFIKKIGSIDMHTKQNIMNNIYNIFKY